MYPRMLDQLRGDMRGYRPKDAVIDLPGAGQLEFMSNLARLADQLVGQKEVIYAANAIEFFHMVRAGNNIKTMASGRVVFREGLLDAYTGICGEYRNPLFRSAAILALLS